MIDIGANLAQRCFADDLPQVLERARAQRVEAIIVTGTDVESSTAAAALAAEHPGYLYATAGVHPHYASQFDDATIASLTALHKDPSVVAVGETGLDFNRNYSSPESQLFAFAAQLELACTLKRPLFLHQRDAHEAFRSVLSAQPGACERAVVHCFTDSAAALEDYLDMGLYIGITGWLCDRKRGATLRDIVTRIPLDRLLIETDAPYLVPQQEGIKAQLAQPRRNEPWTLSAIAGELARLYDVEQEELVNRTSANARQLFRLG